MDSLSFTWGFPGGVPGLLAVSAILLILAVCSYVFSVRRNRFLLKCVPLVLRLLAFGLILYCLCAPSSLLERRTEPKARKPRIAMLFDSSSSMTMKSLKGRCRLEDSLAEAAVFERVHKDEFQFEYFEFSETLSKASSLDEIAKALSRGGLRSTALYKSLAAWTLERGRDFDAAICFGDGVDSSSGAGPELAVDALESGAPPIVFAAATATLKSGRLLELERVEAPDGVRVGSDAQLSAVLRCSGLEPSTELKFVVSRDGRVVASEKLEVLSRGSFTKALNFRVPINSPGLHRFDCAVVADGREEAGARVGVCGLEPQRVKVLLYTGSLDWGVRFLRRAFEGSERVGVEIRYAPDFLGPAAPKRTGAGFPSLDELEKYDVAILMDLRREQIDATLEARLREYLDAGGSILFMVPNAATAATFAGTPLEKLLPVKFENLSDVERASELDPKTRRFLDEMRRHRENLMVVRSGGVRESSLSLPPPTSMVVTDAGAESGVFDYALKNGSIDRNAIPAFEEFAPVKSLKPGAEALAVHPSALAASATPRPLFAVQRFGLGRSAVLATDPLWRWRMTIPSKSNFFESFWAGSIAWLSAGRDLRPRWNLTSLVVPSGKPCRVLFSVPPRGSSFSELDFFAGRENAMKPLAMNASSGPRLYEGFVTLKPGERLLLRAVKKDGSPVAEASVSGGPALKERELLSLRPDLSCLRLLASSCGGKMVERLADLDFKSVLPKGSEEPLVSRTETPLWHKAWLFGLLLLILVLELLARRRLKML